MSGLAQIVLWCKHGKIYVENGKKVVIVIEKNQKFKNKS